LFLATVVLNGKKDWERVFQEAKVQDSRENVAESDFRC